METLITSLPLIGRFLIGFFFFFFGFWNLCHWTPTLSYMQQKKIPFAFFLLAIGILMEIITGLMLIIGIYVKLAALLLIIFDVFAVLIFHPFWTLEGEVRRLNTIIFITNLTASLGALILLLNSVTPSPLTLANLLTP